MSAHMQTGCVSVYAMLETFKADAGPDRKAGDTYGAVCNALLNPDRIAESALSAL